MTVCVCGEEVSEGKEKRPCVLTDVCRPECNLMHWLYFRLKLLKWKVSLHLHAKSDILGEAFSKVKDLKGSEEIDLIVMAGKKGAEVGVKTLVYILASVSRDTECSFGFHWLFYNVFHEGIGSCVCFFR